MEVLSGQEQQWLQQMRQNRDRLFIGIDHHAAQLTVAVAKGCEILESGTKGLGFGWISTRVYDQGSEGYLALLEDLSHRYPEVPTTAYLFLSEPSYAKPCSFFLRQRGLADSQVLWVDIRKVGQFRKTYHLGSSGKNDAEDARTLVAMLYQTSTDPAAPLRLFKVASMDQTAEALGVLAQEHRRITKQSVQIQNKIFQLVLLLFPEARQIWKRTEQRKKPDGSLFEQEHLDLFNSKTPLRVLLNFPGALHIREAGFEAIWAKVGRSGVTKASLKKLVYLAETSAGLVDDLKAHQLKLYIAEFNEIQQRLAAYESEMTAICEQDPVLASFLEIEFLPIQGVATIIGAMGSGERFENADQAKRYLNVAPQPLHHTALVDKKGKPVQIWRLPANSYQRINGQKRLRYESPGRKDVRQVCYLWFDCLYRMHRRVDDPFARQCARLKQTHLGRSRWLGRIRWKVAAKLIETIYYCLKYRRPYDPQKVIVKRLEMTVVA